MEKQYIFKAKILNTCKGYVFAESEEEAKEKIMNGDYEDIYDEYDGEIKEVLSVEKG